MTMALDYETFVRRTFGYPQGGIMLERFGDPAGIANTDYFGEHNIAGIKAAVIYGMEIMSNAVVNSVEAELPDSEFQRFDDFATRVIYASDLRAIHRLIEEYKDTVISKYFVGSDGILSLR